MVKKEREEVEPYTKWACFDGESLACRVLQQQMPAWCRWLFHHFPLHLFGQRAKASGATTRGQLAGGVINLCGISRVLACELTWWWVESKWGAAFRPWRAGRHATLHRSRQAWQHFAPACRPILVFSSNPSAQISNPEPFARWPSSLRQRRGMCFGAVRISKSSHWRQCT